MPSEYSSELSVLFPESSGHRGHEHSLNLKRMLRLRLPLILGVSAALAIPAVIAVWLVVPQEFEASADLGFLETRPRIVFEEGNKVPTSASYERYVNTQVNLIMSPAILQRVLDEPAVRNLPWLAKSGDALHVLMSKVHARIQPGSQTVTVSCKAGERSAALLIVDTAVNKYMEYTHGLENSMGVQLESKLVEERESLKQKLSEQQLQITEKRKALGAPFMVDSGLRPTATEEYQRNRAQAEADLTTAETKVKQATENMTRIQELESELKSAPDKPIFEFNIEDRVSNSPAVAQSRQDLARLDTEIAVLSDRYVESSPQLKVEQERRKAVADQLARAERKIRGEALNSVSAQMRMELTAAQKLTDDARQRQEKFSQLIQQFENNEIEVSQKLAAIQELERKAEDDRARLRTIEQQLYELRVESTAPGRVTLASAANSPAHPDYGRHLQFMLLSLLFSGCFGVGAGLLREMTDQELRSAQDVAGVTPLPILATIPHASADNLPADVRADRLTADHPETTTADEFRRILSRIIYPPEGASELNTCLVVSPNRGDGKTSVACNLAVALARANRRVLLLDISARHPSIEGTFGLEPGPGLSEALSGQYDSNNLIRATEFPNLAILGPGLQSDDMIGKLASREIVAFLERAEESFEHIIIDTPPALLMSDTKLLGPIVDGVIVVAGVGVSTIGMLRRCLQDLQQIGANVTGIVLNGLRPTRGGYLRQNQKLYYTYSHGRGNGASSRDFAPVKVYPASEETAPAVLLVEDRDFAEVEKEEKA
ncbi:MAG: AAA family ATPase [Candidatus Hydrogenedentes bacterium]|nr:AAA family ATPase [Candidatus Hydrogenedentota bacterium]